MHGWILWSTMSVIVVIALMALSFFGTLAYWLCKLLKEGDGHG